MFNPNSPGRASLGFFNGHSARITDALKRNQLLRLDTEWVCDTVGFEALGAVWNRLAALADPGDIFLRFEWFDAAWQWISRECALRILVARRGNEIIGIAPLVLRDDKKSGWRQIEFLGVPDTQRCDIVCEPTDVNEVAEALADALYARAAEWDKLVLQKLPQDSATSAALSQAFAQHGLRPRTEPFDDNPYIDIHGDWESFYSQRGRRLKKANNLVTNRIAKAGEARIERITAACADAAQIKAALADARRVSAGSWKQATATSLDYPGPGAFIERLTEHAIDEGWLSLWLLRLDGTTVATEYQIAYGTRIHALRADFDQTLEEISPGAYLNRQMLESLFSDQPRRYLMGPGNNAYKRRWTDVAENLVALRAFSPSLRGTFWYLWLERIRPALKRVFGRVRATSKQPVDAE